jgi:hypothetical protein
LTFVKSKGFMGHLFRPNGSLADPRFGAGEDEVSVAEVFEPERPNGLEEVGARDPEAPLASLMEFPYLAED